MNRTSFTCLTVLVIASGLGLATSAHAGDAAATYADIEKTFGSVPSFVKAVPKSAIPGLWQQTKELELSETTALPPKVKALISLAVGAQIPCEYCVWIDTNTAKQNGASDEEIGEAIAMAGLTRNWSTVFHGLQVDMVQFKKELGGQ